MVKIWHPKHGFVFSGDDAEIRNYLDTGGEIYVKKDKEISISPASPIIDILEKPKTIKQKDGRPPVRRNRAQIQ